MSSEETPQYLAPEKPLFSQTLGMFSVCCMTFKSTRAKKPLFRCLRFGYFRSPCHVHSNNWAKSDCSIGQPRQALFGRRASARTV